MIYTQEQILEELEKRLKANIEIREDLKQRIEDKKHGIFRKGVLYVDNLDECYYESCGACSALAAVICDIKNGILLGEDFEEGFRHSKAAHKIIKKEDHIFRKNDFKYFSIYKGHRILQASLNPHNSEYCVEELGLDIRWSSLKDCKKYIRIVLNKEDFE